MKRLLSLVMIIIMLATCISATVVTVGAEELSYVEDGLVSYYSGTRNTRDGQVLTSDVWQDLIGTNDIALTINENNYFTESGFHLDTSKNYFPQGIVDVVNGNEFTVEMLFGDFSAKGTGYNTFMNSSNDNFALFRRLSNDVIEFKYAGVPGAQRPTVADGLELLQNSLITVTYKVGGYVTIYVNGKAEAQVNTSSAMGADDLFFGHPDATRNFETVYRSMRFYNRELTAAEVTANAEADGFAMPEINFSGYVTPVQKKTNIIGDITLVRRIDTSAELNDIMSSSTPAAAILTFDENGAIVNVKGDVILTAIEAIGKLDKSVIPVFEIKNAGAAVALVDFLKETGLEDCFVMSDNGEIVKSVREQRTSARGILDLTGKYVNVNEPDTDTLLDIRRNARLSLCTTVLLPASFASSEDVNYLESLQTVVWIDAEGPLNNTEVYTYLLSGAYGIVSDSTSALLKVAGTLAKNTLTRAPLNIGHRGIPSKAPENTLESAILAYENGANVIECDIYMTTDDEIVIMHDATTGTTCNKALDIESSTLAQLKELYVNKGYTTSKKYSKCRIPTLDEYFEEFKGKDVSIFVEIKSSKPEIVAKLKELVDSYGMYSQVNVITFYTSQMSQMMKDFPEMTVGYLCSGLMDESLTDAGIKNVMNTIGKYGTTLNPSYSGYGAACARAALLRGVTIWPWTFGDFETYMSYFMNGYCGLTGNNCDMFGKLVKEISITGLPEGICEGDYTIEAVARDYLRNVTDISSDISVTVISGSEYAGVDGNKLTVRGEGDVVFMVSYKYNASPAYSYTITTQPVTISVKPAAETEDETTEETTVDTTDIETTTVEITTEETTAAETTDTVTTAITTEENYIGIPDTTTASADNTSADNETDKGCGAAALSSLFIIMMSASVPAITVIRKRRDKSSR